MVQEANIRRGLRAVRRLRYASLALVGVLVASQVVWLSESTSSDPSVVWPLLSAFAAVGFLVCQLLVCSSACPACGLPFCLTEDDVFLSWHGFMGPIRCVHCGLDQRQKDSSGAPRNHRKGGCRAGPTA